MIGDEGCRCDRSSVTSPNKASTFSINSFEILAAQPDLRGFPKQDIVLAYHAPHVRQYTEFAVG